jgi:hypothetical protein
MAAAQGAGRPGIKILVAPPAGGDPNRMETIKGEVTGVAFDKYRVALFSQADGRWWPQPFLINQLTRLDDEGRFTTKIHLGMRYAAALVSRDFPPQPAELFDLPNVGGNVLAMDFADPDETRAGADEPVSAALPDETVVASPPPVSVGGILSERLGIPSPAAALTEILSLVSQVLGAVFRRLLWALLIFVALVCVLTFLVLIAAIPAWVVNRTDEFVQAVADWLDAIVNASDTLIGGLQKTIADWMSEETRVRPSLMLIGLICLVIAPLATLANYQLLLFSMESLIPASSDALWMVAGTLTALHAVAGLLFHASQRIGVRLLLFAVLLVSLSCEAWFSFQRTIALENAASAPAVQTFSGVEPNAGAGIDVNTALLSKRQPAAEIKPAPAAAPPSEPERKDEPPWWSWSAITMALITLVCGVVEAVGWYATFHLAGRPLCWAFFAPVYLPAKLLSWVLSGAKEGRLAAWVRVELRSILESPDKYQARLRDWRINRAAYRGEGIRAALAQKGLTEAAQRQLWLARRGRKLESIRLVYDRIDWIKEQYHNLQERKAARRHLAELNAVWRAHMTDLLKSMLPNLSGQFASIYEQAIAAMIEEAKQKASEKAAPIGERIAVNVAEELHRQSEVFSKMNGHYLRDDARKTPSPHANAGVNSQSNRKE